VEVVVAILYVYFVFVVCVMLIYSLRQAIFTVNRLYGAQKISYRDVNDSEMPTVSVLVPMHNEELVLRNVIESLLKCDYDHDKLEIIAINDHSQDKTATLLNRYFAQYPFVRPLHRTDENSNPGKPEALNDAMDIARGDIIIVFDADYRPSKNMLRKIASGFVDPQVGAVMGRVIPLNSHTNQLTELLSLERIGGYQVDQQARYNLGLIPQYGGTVGGYRKHLMTEDNGYDPNNLTEDTELTYRISLKGWNVVYDNSAECYEESPETWRARARQVTRWSRGHNDVMLRYFFPMISARNMRFWKKMDSLLLLCIYLVPFLLGTALLDCVVLFFLGRMSLFSGLWVIIFAGMFNAWGNFAPFYQISAGALLDGMCKELVFLPMLCFSFYFYIWYISKGFLQALADRITHREPQWAKTERFAPDDIPTQKEGT
jgi:cellulose synthase/poly-beta-1,6-N-acetylglucosamine synthase-like glycosyltransferase